MAEIGNLETSPSPLFNYDVREFAALTSSVFQILISPRNEKLSYQAGQYLKISYPKQLFLPFSIANAPRDDGLIELHIRLQENDIETRQMLEIAQRDRVLQFIGPFGDCVYSGHQRPSLLLAGGTGFAQSKALIEAMLAHPQPPSLLHLYWGVRNPEDFYLLDQLLHWQRSFPIFRQTLIISNKNIIVSSNYRIGYTPENVILDYKDLTGYEAYVSGPFPMVLESHRVLLTQGLAKTSFHSDMLG
jgi:CDP-4-dehydro-6-deoxyglucose reductase